MEFITGPLCFAAANQNAQTQAARTYTAPGKHLAGLPLVRRPSDVPGWQRAT